jgi:hypothetical protein
MTVQFVEETVATNLDAALEANDTSTARPLTEVPVSRMGALVASFVLATALASAGAAGTVQIASHTGRRRFEVAESGTAVVESDPELVDHVKELFEQGASEFFEDGVHSAFSRSLLLTLAEHGRAAFMAIAEYLFSADVKPDIVSEALRWLADFSDPATLVDRWSILQRTLRDRSPRVRDGAILGFAALDDPRARPLLLEARHVEQIAELQGLIEQVIEQLNATANAAPAAHRPTEPLA